MWRSGQVHSLLLSNVLAVILEGINRILKPVFYEVDIRTCLLKVS